MRQAMLWITLVIFISACSSAPTKQTFNKAANTHIKTLSLVAPPKIKEVPVVILTHPGRSYGLVGSFIAAADTTVKTNRYNKKIQGKVNWDQYAIQQMTSELKKAGYQLTAVTPRGDKNPESFLSKYPNIPADAVLDFYFIPSNIASGATTNYVPSIRFKARLTDLKNKTVLYEQNFSAGLATNQNTIHFPAQGEYPNIDDLLANSDQTLVALKSGIQQIAQRLASDLKR